MEIDESWRVEGDGVWRGRVPRRMLVIGAVGELVEVGSRLGIRLASLARMECSVMPWFFHCLSKPNRRVGVVELWAKVVETNERSKGLRAWEASTKRRSWLGMVALAN